MVRNSVARTLSFFVLISCLWPSVCVEAQPGASQGEAFAIVDGIAEHRIGPNDVLHITVWNGQAVEETTVRVAEDGTIFVPFGIDLNLKALGLSSTDLKSLIRMESLRYFRETVVQVVIEEYNSSPAYLLGEIGREGAGQGSGVFSLKGRQTVLEFIIEHGGFSERANMSRVQINRASGEVLFLNLYHW